MTQFKYGQKVVVLTQSDVNYGRVGHVHMIQEGGMIGVVFPEDIGINKRTRRRAITNITPYNPLQLSPEVQDAS